MIAPRFSIVIPTRERAETLKSALRTCLEQNHDDYEVVVCDNASSPATRQVVEQAGSSKVRYVRSQTPLAMSANWELAVSHAAGQYVTVLGDDDGLLPCALAELDRLAVRHDEPSAIHWHPALYTWPNIALPGEGSFLYLPVDRWERVFDGRAQLLLASRWQIGAEQLPMIYRSMIRRDLIEEHRRLAGRIFPTLYPDVYSGYAFAFLAGSYLSVSVPLSVSGLSGKSNGVATLLRTDDNPIAEEFNRLQRQAGYARHPTVPDFELLPVNPDDSFQHARDLFFPDDAELALDRQRAAQRYLAAIPHADPDGRARIRRKIREALADCPELQGWFDHLPDPGPQPITRYWPSTPGYDGRGLNLDASRFGVTDVAGAVRLTADVLGLGGEVCYRIPPAQARGKSNGIGLLDWINELEHQLSRAARDRDVLAQQLQQAVHDGALRNVPRRLLRRLAGLLRGRRSQIQVANKAA